MAQGPELDILGSNSITSFKYVKINNPMTYFYDKKYYSRKGIDNRFYIPLYSIPVDLERLREEVAAIPTLNKPSCYGLTTSIKYIDEVPVNFNRYSSISTLNSQGERILPDGERDEEIVHWPVPLRNSYIKKLGDVFSELVQIKTPRVRMSVDARVDYHNDPHTPYRIHIAINSNPEAVWKFRETNGTEHIIYQPADGNPVLIETGKTQHAVTRNLNDDTNKRVHLWYQFHDIISDEILSKF
jgi:hypothetical protein